jgi:acetate CoA/acetoacetate CoA-transferase alpha subunit
MVAKPIISAEKAVQLIKEGSVVMLGGFLGCGSPKGLLEALEKQGTKNLTLVCNDTAVHNLKTGQMTYVAKLVAKKQFKKMIVTHIGTNGETQRQMNAGETEVVLVPQGTLAEQIRAAGAGLGGVLTPTGVGTEVQEGKKVIEIDGKKFLLEKALGGDVALIKAKKADKAGNLVFDKTERNFNPLMAMACTTVIVEANEIVEIGEIDPEIVVTPSVFVHYLVQAAK